MAHVKIKLLETCNSYHDELELMQNGRYCESDSNKFG